MNRRWSMRGGRYRCLHIMLVLVAVIGVSAADMVTKSGRYFGNYSIIQQNDDLTVSVLHDDGVVKVPLGDLPDYIAQPYIQKVIEQTTAAAEQTGDDPGKKVREVLELIRRKAGESELERLAKPRTDPDTGIPRQAHAVDQAITVRAQGQGENYQEALADAFRYAVRKAVGVYVVTQTRMQNEDLTEEICLNADAVISKYKELEKSEENGIVTLTIEAVVIRNSLALVIQKVRSNKITKRDIANLMNRRKALDNAEKSLEYIFQSFGQKIYNPSKIGISADDNVGDKVRYRVTYEFKFNHHAYYGFEERMANLLRTIAYDEKSGEMPFDALLRKDNPIYVRERSKGIPPDAARVVFFDEYESDSRRVRRYHIFIVPARIASKIDNSIYNKFSGMRGRDALLFKFEFNNSEKVIRKAILCKVGFWMVREIAGRRTYIFRNAFWGGNGPKARVFNIRRTQDFLFPASQIFSINSCTLKYCTGANAAFVYYCFSPEGSNFSALRGLAESGYVPAMLVVAEHDPGWYHVAALMGNPQAQQKLRWNNGGLGIAIKEYNGKYMVYSSPMRLSVMKGMVIKSIGDNNISRMSIEDLSKYIGSLSPGESVSLTFDGGEKIDVTVMDK